MKNNKGITLVALIITIVILLILAGVAVASIKNNGILYYAQNSATSYNEAQKNEAGIIGGYEEYLNNMGKIEESEKVECSHTYDSNTGKCTLCGSNCKHNYNENGYCLVCDFECKHEGLTTDINYNGEGTHDYSYYCGTCGYSDGEPGGDCTFSNGVCTVCNGVCEHSDGWDDLGGCCEYCGESGWEE